MEFDFNINHLFPDVISLAKLDVISAKQNIQRVHLQKNLQRTYDAREIYEELAEDTFNRLPHILLDHKLSIPLKTVIDELGKKSAKAQQLSGSITNLEKSLIHGHHIYVLKDSSSNNGRGSVIGFIKVGKKRLFLLDFYGTHNEMHPLCVLDFYVHESQQRKGCGLRLFRHMLSKENVKANHLAVDRPSHKFSSFLKKHFNLWVTIPQVNNFVIFDGFFKNRTDTIRSSNSRSNTNLQLRPLSRAVSDDMIRKSRLSQSEASSLKGIRPVSGCEVELNQGYNVYSNRNNRRRRWNPDGTWHSSSNHSAPIRANSYSRFSHETCRPNGLPPIHPSRMQNHVHTRDDYKADAAASETKSTSLDSLQDKTQNTENDVQLKRLSPTVLSKSENALDSRKQGEPLHGKDVESVENPFKSVETVQAGRYIPRYSHPSDMLAELKAKDKLSLEPSPPVTVQPPSQDHPRRKRFQHRSSWNVFGVPSVQYWTLH